MTLPIRPLFRRLAAAGLLALAGATSLGLAGCASPTPADYASQGPLLDLRQYFNGKLLAHGLVTDRSGKVLQRFTVALTGSWVGDTGTLTSASPMPTAARKPACGRSSAAPTATTSAPRPTCWARHRARPQAMR
jgi:hypothetical protein